MPPQLVLLLPLLLVAGLLLPMRRTPAIMVGVENDVLQVRLGTWDKLYCFRRDLAVPVSDVEGVAVAPRQLVPAVGLRLPGTVLPGVVRAGSFGTGASRDFWDVRKSQTLMVIELRSGAEYRRIVLELADPSAVARELRPMLGAFTGTFV